MENALKTPLLRARETAGLLQAKLAALSGVSTSQLWLYEHGYKQPTRRVAERIAAALGCDVGALWEMKNGP